MKKTVAKERSLKKSAGITDHPPTTASKAANSPASGGDLTLELRRRQAKRRFEKAVAMKDGEASLTDFLDYQKGLSRRDQPSDSSEALLLELLANVFFEYLIK